MKYLNIGCGAHYSTKPEWTNIDFESTSVDVIAHNLLEGIPFPNNQFDLVYHSHVLEHFSKDDGENVIVECFRVLNPGGILRIAVPDLEIIVRNYLKFLEEGINDESLEIVSANYDWMMLEMYDQTVRNYSGGKMAEYLYQDSIKNENFVFDRLGEEASAIRKRFLNSRGNKNLIENVGKSKIYSFNFLKSLRKRVEKYLLMKLNMDEKAMTTAKFRMRGEIHQWMYDRYSISKLLKKYGGINIEIRDGFISNIPDWASYELDGKNGVLRKPDSIFVESQKK